MAERSRSTKRRSRVKPATRKKASVPRTAVKRKPAATRRAPARPASANAQLRALRQELAKTKAEIQSLTRTRERSVSRLSTRAQRDRDALEAQLTKLVQEIGQLRHQAERAQRLEADCRSKDALLAERTRQWEDERAALVRELGELRAREARRSTGEGDVTHVQPELFPEIDKS